MSRERSCWDEFIKCLTSRMTLQQTTKSSRPPPAARSIGAPEMTDVGDSAGVPGPTFPTDGCPRSNGKGDGGEARMKGISTTATSEADAVAADIADGVAAEADTGGCT
jgi:hypothetical protein